MSTQADPSLTPGPLVEVEGTMLVADPNDNVGGFFLSLARGFNDLKGMVIFEKFLQEKGRPSASEISPYRGEWFGVMVQIHRYVAGILHEIMELIRQNADADVKVALKALLPSLTPRAQATWDSIVAAATGAAPSTSADVQTLNVLRKIRNQSAFHYYIEPGKKVLAKAYLKYFGPLAKDAPTEANRAAMYSAGNSMEETRFYYADAASQQVMMGFTERLGDRTDTVIVKLAKDVNHVLGPLLAAFARSRTASKESKTPA